MTISFHKYQGAGNDFLLINNQSGEFSGLSQKVIAFLCDRHFGIGADGLMFLEKSTGKEDFFMRYYNSDGLESSMCGNGGRCITAFAKRLLGTKKNYSFCAIDGLHSADVLSENGNECTVRLQMANVTSIEKRGTDYFLNTGSPHLVRFTSDVNAINIIPESQTIRYNEPYKAQGGTNINFVQTTPDSLLIRTYERGVEDETLACGTGATAAAIATQVEKGTLVENMQHSCHIQARGGLLIVQFDYQNGGFTNIFLTGPATFVFEGQIEI